MTDVSLGEPARKMAKYESSSKEAKTGETRQTLVNGKGMPYVGLGTWLTKPEEVGANIITAARLGYRHFDCAERYQNQRDIGKAFSQLWKEGFDRSEFFITSKLWNTRHDKVEDSVKQTLKNLELEYLDLYLIHFPESFPAGASEEDMAAGKCPPANVPMKDTWTAMEGLVEKGLVKSIGVSNFAVCELEEILSYAKIPPAVNQVEVHPYNSSTALVEFCQSKKITVTAYSVLANQFFLDEVDPNNPRRAEIKLPPLLQHDVVVKTARKHKKTPAQVILRWCMQRQMVMLQKSLRKERLDENRDIFDFQLDDDDMKALAGLNCNYRLVTPSWRKWPGEKN